MSTARQLHREAMQLVEQSDRALSDGDDVRAADLMEQAFESQREAANRLIDNLVAEPTRSVLLRSAAVLALRCHRERESERLVHEALRGNPPEEIAEELRNILEDATFERHLRVLGVSLRSEEVQFSIAGKAIAYGMAPYNEYNRRISTTNRMMHRTVERKRGVPFQERSVSIGAIAQEYTLYLSAARPNSIAVTLRLGHVHRQASFADAIDTGIAAEKPEEIIDEFLECLELYNDRRDSELQQRIGDDAYYTNFVALVNDLAPDGSSINQVGFTVIRGGHERQVALRRLSVDEGDRRTPGRKRGQWPIAGTLDFADSRRRSDAKVIIVTDGSGKEHWLTVPDGMMADVVKPLYEEQVVVYGRREPGKRRPVLTMIQRAADATLL